MSGNQPQAGLPATVTATPDPPFPAHRSAPRARPAPVLHWGLTGKLGLLSGALVLILLAAVAAVLVQTRQTTDEYDQLLAAQVSDALAARQIQVEFKRQVQEWKDILLRGSNLNDLTTYTANFHQEDGIVRELTDRLVARTTDPEVRNDLVTFRTEHEQLDAAYARALGGFVASGGRNVAATDHLVRGQDRPPTTLLDGVVTHLTTTVNARVTQQKVAAADRERAGLAATLVLLLGLAILITVVVRRLVRPIRGLTVAARRVASETLPATIAQIKAMPAAAEPPTLPAFRVDTHDELRDLAQAFTQVQDSAVRLAAEQHRAEREAAEMLINLGRRNQNLLSRLLSQVSELERTEQDAEVLGQLFRLDHAATRIRRNAESMLVLAGAAQTRTFAVPVPFEDLIRAALSEIEDYVRVDLYHIEEGTIIGSAAADLVHLLAELIENATHFSPPHSQVTVVGQRVREGYRIRVIDQGVGMTQRELSDANDRILRATQGWADAKLLGLYVVGRLAVRRGIEVTLEPSAARGITATVAIPARILADLGGLPGPAADTRQRPDTRQRGADTRQRPDTRQRGADTRQHADARPGADPAPQAPADHPSLPAAPQQRVVRDTGTNPAGQPVPAMPQRVRGAQLAGVDLGEADREVAFAPAPEWSRWNLRSFQLDVGAARRMIAEEFGPPAEFPVPAADPVVDLTVHEARPDPDPEAR